MHRLSLVFVLMLIIVAGCSNATAETTTTALAVSTSTTAAPTTTAPPTTTTTIVLPSSPLNGLPAEDPALLDRRVIAIKIDNHWNARPQSGLNQADAVFELPVEASLTRFIALFHDNDSEFVGPMRSGRPTDPTLLRPLGATFVISGAQDWVIARINAAGVPLIGEVRPETFRVGSRYAPHNLYANSELLRGRADDRSYPDDPPQKLFELGEFAGGEPATEIFFDWSGTTQVTWKWDGNRYQRWTGGDYQTWIDGSGEESGPIEADTLVVLFATRYTAAGSSGSAVPAMETVGSGVALVFAAGEVRQGTWSRDTIEEPFLLEDAEGGEMIVPVGVPWINVFPDSRQVTW